ncbi:hypothetical protein [Variovorax guangxiensis]|uniref:hypothetical protein n=1 Tax=Variovorax guangxiensis TaxID=1775474 RepID=UPI00112AAF69|nr:hypothetical protein [Variovorax guangxiensis]
MGTTLYRATKAQAVADELRDIGIRSAILGHCLKGSRLWVLAQVKEGSSKCVLPGTRWISLSLINVHGPEVAVKRLDETCGPCYYDCPLAFLELVSEPEGPYAGTWREKVRAFHAQNALGRQHRRLLEVGSRVAYGAETYLLQRPLGRRGWEVLRERDHCPMRMTARQFNHCQWPDPQPGTAAFLLPCRLTTAAVTSTTPTTSSLL